VVDLTRIVDRDGALRFFGDRIGRGVQPGLERISGVLDYLADPHRAYPVVHIAGTNGKTTVARLLTDVLGAHGLKVGTFTSPHLHRIEERIAIAGRPIDTERFVRAVDEIAWPVEEYERRHDEGPTYFELSAALAFSVFAADAVDVAVVEVGLGGRLDATNVVDAAVCVVTGIAIDHSAYLGDTAAAIAGEKVAILDPGGILVTGPLPAAAEGPVTARVAATGSRWLRHGADFSVVDARPAVGGWTADLSGTRADYDELYLALHGRHQVDHLATVVATAETFLGSALDDAALRAAAAGITSPGRLEVIARRPLVIVDGAHNVQGFHGLADTLRVEFPDLPWQLVVGARGDRDVAELLEPLRGLVAGVVATAPDDPAAIPIDEVATAAASLGVPVTRAPSVAAAFEQAVNAAGGDGGVVVAGSLYVAGEARALVAGEELRPSAVHVRVEPPELDFDDDETR